MKTSNFKNDLFRFEIGEGGIAIITIDQINNPTNLFSAAFIESYADIATKAIQDDDIKGVIVTSGQRMFMPGADLRELKKAGGKSGDQLVGGMKMHRTLRSIETGGKPFVAAINGTAMGGGLELCLTCHHRIVLNNPKIKLGFPEIKVGLFPGAGGTVKTPYLLGLQNAFMYLLKGIEARPEKAVKDGLVDAIANSPEELISLAKKWITDNPKPVQPWDNPAYKLPGGSINTRDGQQIMMAAISTTRKLTHGNYPGANAILSVVHDSISLPMDRALEVEARYFAHVVQTKEAKNMIRTGFLEMQKARKGKARPKDEPPYEVKKIGIIGAGMMGAGIAYVSAKAGIYVILKDINIESAERGKNYSKQLLNKAISKRRATQQKADSLLSKITTADDPKAVMGCDLIIEAVFENPDLKATVTKESEEVLGEEKIYASNTSTIPITQLAKASRRPENFIGIHFFSPVDKMPLVEIIVGEKTGNRAIAAAVDYAVAIRKIPIVVNDSRGFFTSRCFGTYVSEGMFLLEEGVPAAMIENIAKTKGLPVGPLAVQDEVSLTLGMHVYESDPSPNKHASQKRSYEIQKMMVEKYGRGGKKQGAGFYEYPKGGKKKLWPELGTIFNSKTDTLDKETIAKRILHRQALEAFRCLEEGVLNSVVDGDIGSVLGWGFPIYTGGALSYIDFVGMSEFIAECDRFHTSFGERWQVPDSLRKLEQAGKSIHDFAKLNGNSSAEAIQNMKEADVLP